MPTKRDDLNGAEHDNKPTHKLEDVQVYKVDLVKRPATGDAFLAVRSKDAGGEEMPRRRNAMSVDQFRKQYRPTGDESVTIAQRGDPVGQAPVDPVKSELPGTSPGNDNPQETSPPEQGVERESNENKEGDEMTKAMLERMDKLTATVGALVERMTPEEEPGVPAAAPAPEADPAADTDAEAVTEPGAEPPAAPAPEADPAADAGDEPAATPEADPAPVAPEPEATATIPLPADAVVPSVDTAAVERMTDSLDSVVSTMEGVTRGLIATGEAVTAMGGRVTTVAEQVSALTERMDSVERGMSTSNADPVDETEEEPGTVERSKGGVFKGVLFGGRGR